MRQYPSVEEEQQLGQAKLPSIPRTGEVIFVAINPNFIAGIVKWGIVSEYELKLKEN